MVRWSASSMSLSPRQSTVDRRGWLRHGVCNALRAQPSILLADFYGVSTAHFPNCTPLVFALDRAFCSTAWFQ